MTSTTDLNAYASLAASVAALEVDDELAFSLADFSGDAPQTLPCPDLIIDPNYRRFMGSAGPGEDRPFEIFDKSLGFITYAEPETLRRIGLWMLHLLFSGREWGGLELTHPKSRTKWLYVQIERPLPDIGFLKVEGRYRYTGYEHFPQEVRRHPFAEIGMSGVERVLPEHRPFFAFGWSKPDWNSAFDHRTSDQIIMELTPEGLCAMSSLFFDIGHSTLGHNEVDMEPPHVGFAATQPRSIEARFYMPGSLGFYADTLDGLTLPPLT